MNGGGSEKLNRFLQNSMKTKKAKDFQVRKGTLSPLCKSPGSQRGQGPLPNLQIRAASFYFARTSKALGHLLHILTSANAVINLVNASKSLKSKTSTGEWLYLPGQERLT
jgi:hypothetical protein